MSRDPKQPLLFIPHWFWAISNVQSYRVLPCSQPCSVSCNTMQPMPCVPCKHHASTMPYRAKPCNTMQHLAIFLRNIQQCRATYIMKNTCNIQCNNKQHHIRAVTCNIDATRGNPVVPCLGRGRPGHPVRDGFVRSRLEHGERGAHALQA